MLKDYVPFAARFRKAEQRLTERKDPHVCMLSQGVCCPNYQGYGAQAAGKSTILCRNVCGSDEYGEQVKLIEKTIPEARNCQAEKIAEARTEPETPPGT